MTKLTVAVVAFLVLIGIAAGLYTTGPKYVVENHQRDSFARIYCQNGFEQKRRQVSTHPQPGVAYAAGIRCLQRADGWHWVRDDERYIHAAGIQVGVPGSHYTTIRRAAAWERVWYAIVGSKNTRG